MTIRIIRKVDTRQNLSGSPAAGVVIEAGTVLESSGTYGDTHFRVADDYPNTPLYPFEWEEVDAAPPEVATP